ncbi:MAG TPA: 6-carboxytetrahydropterin synthase [Terriglobia bacterium]|nr:6-carboxytetrahydropterin synthase [Terriglobia bacterium]
MVHLTHRYRISAAHRLHNPVLTDEENARLYGKCNNPRGHGHDYALEVTVCGKVNPATGMVVDIGLLDEVVQRQVLDRFDHKHLNLDVEEFRTRVPTTENLCLVIYDLLAHCFPLSRDREANSGNSRMAARLEKVRVEETRSNFFEYQGEEGLRSKG